MAEEEQSKEKKSLEERVGDVEKVVSALTPEKIKELFTTSLDAYFQEKGLQPTNVEQKAEAPNEKVPYTGAIVCEKCGETYGFSDNKGVCPACNYQFAFINFVKLVRAAKKGEESDKDWQKQVDDMIKSGVISRRNVYQLSNEYLSNGTIDIQDFLNERIPPSSDIKKGDETAPTQPLSEELKEDYADLGLPPMAGIQGTEQGEAQKLDTFVDVVEKLSGNMMVQIYLSGTRILKPQYGVNYQIKIFSDAELVEKEGPLPGEILLKLADATGKITLEKRLGAGLLGIPDLYKEEKAKGYKTVVNSKEDISFTPENLKIADMTVTYSYKVKQEEKKEKTGTAPGA